ncbi:hypothetical protein MBLNU459_g0959t1 [Dothideomycetes sp. NU459]
MENMKDTAWDFALVLRQKYQEEVFRRALKELGVELEAPVTLDVIAVNEPEDGYRVTATVKNGSTGISSTILCKYLIGCDGGRSTLILKIKVRIDGLIKTNVPKPRTYCAIESPTHGNVLWAALDRGTTRIGYAFTAERAKAYSTFDEAAAVKEAIAAVKPFEVSFERVDWWTIYSVGQRIAQRFFVQDCVFLAGDACHTHSSGAAQGMNTGLHDSVNLAWKLALVLRGVAKPEILNTYETERLPNVEKLIKYDKDIARLMSLQLPEGWLGDPRADPNDILGEVMKKAGTFSSGLGIYYELEDANKLSVMGSFACGSGLETVRPGKRAPDVILAKPGTLDMKRLIQQTPNSACFYIVVFAGDPSKTRPCLKDLDSAMRHSRFLNSSNGAISWLTICAAVGPSAYELLGVEPFGKILYDPNENAHRRYGIAVESPTAVIVRPDGWVGTMIDLKTDGCIAEMEKYFSGFMNIESAA